MDAARTSAAASDPLAAISDRLTAIATGQPTPPRAIDRALDDLLVRHGRRVEPIAPAAIVERVRTAPGPVVARHGLAAGMAAAVGAASVVAAQAMAGRLGLHSVVALAPAIALLLPCHDVLRWHGIVLCAVLGGALMVISGIAALLAAPAIPLLLIAVGLAWTVLARPLAALESAVAPLLGSGSGPTTQRLLGLILFAHGSALAGAA